jgi:hypothetical protein
MKNLYPTVIIASLLIFNFNSIAQFGNSMFVWPEGLGFSNQLEYSYDIDTKREILENWLNLDYSKGIFSAGLRFEVFQPNDPDPSISRGKDKYADIAYKYFRADIGSSTRGLDIQAGNFYSLFGRGMVLKSYEERNIRVDNNLLGLKAVGKYDGFVLTGLTGMPENATAERNDIFHAADLEYRGWRPLRMGLTYAVNDPVIEGAAKTSMGAFRLAPSIWHFDIYAEYSFMQNKDVEQNIFNGEESIIGEGFYGNMNFYFDSFSLLGEYKYYDNIAFTTNDGTVNYNTPPAVRLEYTYTLPNRHPSPLNQNNEEGYQLAAAYNFDDETYLTAAYTQTNSLPAGSFYQRSAGTNVAITTQLREIYVTAQRDWSSSLSTVAAFSYNEELATNTKNITPILENRFYFGGVNTIKVVLEHQHSTAQSTTEKYYTDVLALEYLRSPKFNVALVAELETREPQSGRVVRKFWSFIQAGYKIAQHTDISLLVGTRQAGNICIGGVCRFEPAFKGIELKMLTRL